MNTTSNDSDLKVDDIPVPKTSLLPEPEPEPLAAEVLLKQVVQGAHSAIDALADRAAPAVRQLGLGVAQAKDTLEAKSDQIREKADVWTAPLQRSVQANPLLAVAAAFALGALIARLTR